MSAGPGRRPWGVAVLAGLAACGGDTSSGEVGAARSDSAGIEIVISSTRDRPLGWTFERDLVLGGADDGPESFALVRSFNVGADATGNIFVLDTQAHRVVVFGQDGAFLREMGGEGGGPGELQFPNGLAIAPDGTAAVFDIGKRSLVRFGPSGENLPPIAFPMGAALGGRHYRFSGDDIIVSAARGSGQRAELLSLPTRTRPDTVVLAGLDLPQTSVVDLGCAQLLLPPIFSPAIHWEATPEGVVAAPSGAYRLDVMDLTGRVTRSIRRPISVGRATRDLAEEEVRAGMRIGVGGGSGCQIGADELVEDRGFADVIPAIANVAVAPTGETWVARRIVGQTDSRQPLDGPIDVFDPSGAYLGTLPEGTEFPLLFLPDGRIGYGERDALDIERLVIARIGRD